VRPESAHDLHYITQQRLPRPVTVGFGGGLGVTKVVRSGEILMRAIDATSRQQFLSANDSQRLTQLVADQILPSIATREREVSCLDVASASEPRDQSRILVVRMRADSEYPGVNTDRRTAFALRTRRALLRAPRSGNQNRGDREAKRGSPSHHRPPDAPRSLRI
jgi:hypothetical protein